MNPYQVAALALVVSFGAVAIILIGGCLAIAAISDRRVRRANRVLIRDLSASGLSDRVAQQVKAREWEEEWVKLVARYGSGMAG